MFSIGTGAGVIGDIAESSERGKLLKRYIYPISYASWKAVSLEYIKLALWYATGRRCCTVQKIKTLHLHYSSGRQLLLLSVDFLQEV